MIRRNSESNCFRSGGRAAMKMPTESSTPDQITGSVLSYDGSLVLRRVGSVEAFTIEQVVTLAKC